MLKGMRQEIYDYVKMELIRQGKPGLVGPNGSCQIRNTDGSRCAIGQIFPDWAYEEMISNDVDPEDLEPSEIPDEIPALCFLWGVDSETDYRFFRDLQRAHDWAALSPSNLPWKDRLVEHFNILAGEYELVA